MIPKPLTEGREPPMTQGQPTEWGWDLFDAYGSQDGRWQVQKFDVPDAHVVAFFADDSDAWVHVWKLALLFDAGTCTTLEARYASAVIGFLKSENSLEYERMMRQWQIVGEKS